MFQTGEKVDFHLWLSCQILRSTGQARQNKQGTSQPDQPSKSAPVLSDANTAQPLLLRHSEQTMRGVNPVNKITANLAFPVPARLSCSLHPNVTPHLQVVVYTNFCSHYCFHYVHTVSMIPSN